MGDCNFQSEDNKMKTNIISYVFFLCTLGMKDNKYNKREHGSWKSFI